MDVQKKISFTFSKSSKPLTIVNTKKSQENNDIELIDCLEEQSIKVRNAVEEEKIELVIPLREDAKNLLDRVKQAQQIKNVKNGSDIDQRPDSELTLDELAARQLLKEATTQPLSDIQDAPKISVLPLSSNQQSLQNKINESTLEDYNNVPVNDFGLAMLRGMGWSKSAGIGKHNQVVKPVEPELRPKGMGLGANQILNVKKIVQDPQGKQEEELLLVKGAFVKVIGGTNKGKYCEVVGLDDELGRVIVKTAIKQNILSLNEFLLELVSKEEYTNNGKVINNAKYEEYKKKSKDLKKRDGDRYEHRRESDKERHMQRSDSHRDKPDNINAASTSTRDDRTWQKHRKEKRREEDKSRVRSRSRDRSKERRHKHKKRKKHKEHRRDSNSSERESRKRRY